MFPPLLQRWMFYPLPTQSQTHLQMLKCRYTRLPNRSLWYVQLCPVQKASCNNRLRPVYTGSFYVTIFIYNFLVARVDEENWPIFMWQIYLLRSWRVSFYVTNKTCHIRKIACVDDSSHKMWQILRQHMWSPIFHWVLRARILVRISAVRGLNWRTELWNGDK